MSFSSKRKQLLLNSYFSFFLRAYYQTRTKQFIIQNLQNTAIYQRIKIPPRKNKVDFGNKRIKCLIFVPVKNKIYAISLILSFWVVLSHEMIHHHHHDSMADGLFSNQSDVDFSDEKINERNSDDEHNHPFPLHHHSLATSDIVYVGTNLLKSNSPNRISTLLVMSIVFQDDYYKPPCTTSHLYIINRLIVSSLFNPEANALRGPPAIV